MSHNPRSFLDEVSRHVLGTGYAQRRENRGRSPMSSQKGTLWRFSIHFIMSMM